MASVGDELPLFEVPSVDPEKMKTMSALLRDPNPIHFDVDSVKRLGMGHRVVNQGPNNMAYLVTMLARYSGGPGNVTSLRVRFLDNVFAGDRLVAGGRVTGVDGSVVECEVWLARDGEHPVVTGTASVVTD